MSKQHLPAGGIIVDVKMIRLGISLVVIAIGLFVCSIHDDAGNPVITSETVQEEIPRITILPFDPVESGDTIAITIFLWKDTTSITPIANSSVSVSVSHGWLSGTTITTNSSGYATVQFSDTLLAANSETRVITFQYLSADTSADITVSNETIVLQKHYMTISASSYVIFADGISTSAITVKIKNETFNPVPGETIIFATNAGDITASNITDASGVATATLTSEKRNVIALITASMTSDTSKEVTTKVEFTGISISTTAEPQSIVPNGIDSSIITMTLHDAADHAIYGEKVDFHTQTGSVAILTIIDSVTDTRGQARCKIVGTSTGRDTIIVKAAGDSALVVINYSSNFLVISPASGSSLVANGTDSTLITITYYAANGVTKISGADLYISVTSGAIDTVFTKVDVTDANGQVSFYLQNPDFATTATITVTASKGGLITNGTYDLYFKADIINRIILNGTPEVISTGGDIATITATAYDFNGNLVKDAVISYKLASGPGAGEYLNPPTSITNESGMAVTTLVSGNSPSTQQDVWVIASSFSGVTSDVFKFTIAGPPAYVTFGIDVGDMIEYPDGTYGLNCAALVTDINRNPVKDGTPVTFSMQIIAFRIFRRTAVYNPDSLKWFETTPCAKSLIFEDLNDNFTNDPGETDHTGYPLYRGEDVVLSEGDRNYNPGPPFWDYNCNGRRDYNPSFTNYQSPEPYEYVPALDSIIWMDYYENKFFDTVEPLVDPNMTDAQYEAHPDFIPGYGYPDRDWNDNGVPDPATTVIITKNVSSAGGKAINQIMYNQSDGWRLKVKVWVESEGVSSLSPDIFTLPVTVGDAPYYNYFEGKKYY